jgi:hypothetical protein
MQQFDKLIELIPVEIRQTFYKSIHRMPVDIRKSFVEVNPVSIDVTSRCEIFKRHMDPKKMVLPIWSKILNEFPFPDIRCPLGCSIFVDKDVTLLPLIHYVNFLDPKVEDFRGNRSWLIGKRPTWPDNVNVMGIFQCCPGIVADKDLGLCFFSCSAKIHRLKGVEMIHVPQTPGLIMATNKPDNLGLAVCSANIKKMPKVSEYNYSSRVVKIAGTQVGMSTTTIHARPIGNTMMSEDERIQSAIVMKNRPDVRQHVRTISGIAEEKRWLQLYEEMKDNYPLFEEEIEESRRGGTFIHSDYASDLMDLYLRQKVLEIPDGIVDADLTRMALELKEKSALKQITKYVRFPIFNNCQFGRVPYVLWPKWFDRVNCWSGTFSLAKIVTELMCNNVQLYRSFLESFTRLGSNEVYREMLSNVAAIVRHTYASTHPMRGKAWVQPLERFETFIQKSRVQIDEEDCDALAHFLSRYCNGVLFYKRGKYSCLEDMFDITDYDQFDTVLISRSADPLIEQEDSLDDLIELLKVCEYHLMGMVFTEKIGDIHFAMRWKVELKWQVADEVGNSRIIIDEHDLVQYEQSANVLIFQREPKHLKRIRLDIKMMTGCQNIAECCLHQFALIREPKDSSILCCVGTTHCLSSIAYRCPNGLSSGRQCEVGVCQGHFRTIKNAGKVIKIKGKMLLDVVEQITDPITMKNKQLLDLKAKATAKRKEKSMLVSGLKEDGKTLDVYGNRASAGHYLLNTFCKMRPTRYGRLQTPVAAQCVLQNIVSTSSDNRVSLLYPEAQLFPQMIWRSSGESSYVGALSYTCFGSEQECRNIQPYFGSLADHTAVRIRDASLLSSQDSVIRSIYFDAMVNELSRRFPIKAILVKGPEALLETQYKDGVDVNLSDGDFGFDNNSIGVNRGVNQLANDIRTWGKWDYFVTITCNDKGTPGVKPLMEKIIKIFGKDEDMLARAYASLLPVQIRMWDRFKDCFLDWLRYSPDEPLGPNVELFARDEFQSKGSLGNKNHVHIGVRSTSTESIDVQLRRIRNTLQTFFAQDTGLDFQSALNTGYVDSLEEWTEMVNEWKKFNHHFCSDPNARCHVDRLVETSDAKRRKVEGGQKKTCRARKYHDSLVYDFRARSDMYSKEMLDYMEYVDLTVRNAENVLPKQCMIGGTYTYPSKEEDGMQPTVPAIFVACRSSTNVQKTDFKFVIAYLLKYGYGLEEHVISYLMDNKAGQIQATSGNIENIKIGSRKRKRVIENRDANVREICEAEIIKVLMKSPYINKDIESVHVSTRFPEERSAILKFHHKQKTESNGLHMPPSMVYYEGFDEVEDKFTLYQEVLIVDWFTGDWAIDNTLWFSVRPPLLRAVDSLEIFAGCFIRGKLNQVKSPIERMSLIDGNLVDGSNHVVKIRISMLPTLVEFVRNNCNGSAHANSHSGQTLLWMLLDPLEQEFNNFKGTKSPEYSEFFRRFVDIKATKKVAVVFSTISPRNGSKFLYHLLLIYGRFITELDLCASPDFREWFTAANIMPPMADITDQDVQRLCQKYAGDFFIYKPISHKQTCTELRQTVELLKSFFMGEQLLYDGPAIILNKSIKEVFLVELDNTIEIRKMNLVAALLSECETVKDLPSCNDLLSDRRIAWHPEITQKSTQSAESFQEQEKAWQLL